MGLLLVPASCRAGIPSGPVEEDSAQSSIVHACGVGVAWVGGVGGGGGSGGLPRQISGWNPDWAPVAHDCLVQSR